MFYLKNCIKKRNKANKANPARFQESTVGKKNKNKKIKKNKKTFYKAGYFVKTGKICLICLLYTDFRIHYFLHKNYTSPEKQFSKPFFEGVFGMPNMIQAPSFVSDLLAVLL